MTARDPALGPARNRPLGSHTRAIDSAKSRKCPPSTGLAESADTVSPVRPRLTWPCPQVQLWGKWRGRSTPRARTFRCLPPGPHHEFAVEFAGTPFSTIVTGSTAMSGLFAIFMPGPMEMLIIAGIMLLLFGGRLPSVMRNLGRGVVEFKKGISGVEEEVGNAGESVPGKEAEKEA